MALLPRLMVYGKLGDISLERVNWIGVLVLLVGAALGFFAVPIASRLWPDKAEQRTAVLRLCGTGVAMLGTLLSVRIFG